MTTQKRTAKPVRWVILLILIGVLAVLLVYTRNQSQQGGRWVQDMNATQRANIATSIVLTNAP